MWIDSKLDNRIIASAGDMNIVLLCRESVSFISIENDPDAQEICSTNHWKYTISDS